MREKKWSIKAFMDIQEQETKLLFFVYVSVCIIYYHRTLLIVDWVYFLPKYCIILISLEVEGSVPKPRTQHWNGAIISFWQMIQLMIEKTHRQAIFFSLSTGEKEPRKRLIMLSNEACGVFMLVRMELIVRYLGLVNVLDCFNLAWKFDNKKFNMKIFT